MQPKTCSLGITGGIGCGKSYVCHLLEIRGIPIFYTDEEARLEVSSNSEIHADLYSLLGANVLHADGTLNKPLLSAYICQGTEFADRVNAIVHPRVKQRLHRWIDCQTAQIVGVECALLFESHFNEEVNRSVVVTAPLELRVARVMARDGKSRQDVLRWISLQMPEEEKVLRADFVIRNDEVHPLQNQIDSMLRLSNCVGDGAD